MKVLIVGGVAGGASAAARLRRLDERARIILLERGEYVSYANCGLPYYIGGEITEREKLTVQTPEGLRRRLNIDVRTGEEAIEILREEKALRIRRTASGETYTESYDALLLSPGAEPIRPPLPGLDDPRVFTLRNIPDTLRMDAFIKERKPKTALVVGGGYIGLELAENLHKAGLAVTVVELAEHVIAPLDEEMAAEVHPYLRQQGVTLLRGTGLTAIGPREDGLHAALTKGTAQADMVVLSIGVRPETGLAKAAGLRLGTREAIIVDEHMRTSDPDIYAVGDAVQVVQVADGQPAYIPLAGPANKQGRIAADNIAGVSRAYKGSQGSAVLKLFDMTIGTTGLSEAAVRASGIAYDKAYLGALSHAGYYPGAEPMEMKVLFEKPSGRILGAQIVGFGGVDKRLDQLATAIRFRMTAEDLTELELAYAPPYSSAKDPVNMAGYMIQDVLEGHVRQFHWHDVARLLEKGAALVDVRTPEEYARGTIPGALSLPVDDIRDRLDDLPGDRPLYLFCHSGQRSYVASRILMANGYDVQHLAGGFRLYRSVMRDRAER